MIYHPVLDLLKWVMLQRTKVRQGFDSEFGKDGRMDTAQEFR
jgi:hypothetical protein